MVLPPSYAELHCLSNFSFLRGASHPEELVARAKALGYRALAITDECSVAGAVRAHLQARGEGLKLLIGSEFALADGPRVVLLAPDRAAYGDLCEIITAARRGAKKGAYRLTRDDLAAHAGRCLALWLPDDVVESGPCIKSPSPPPLSQRERGLTCSHLEWLREVFPGRLWIAVELLLNGCDQERLVRLQALGERFGVPLVAAGGVQMHKRDRKRLHDVLAAIRLGTTVQAAGQALAPNGERCLRPRATLARFYPPALLDETVRIASRCTFSLDELRYEYPDEIVPPGETPASYLRRLTEEGMRRRWPVREPPQKVRELVERELALIAELKYEPYFLTVYDVVRYARDHNIYCQGRGSAANSAVCFCLGITEVDPDRIDTLFERFVSKERNEPPDIDVDFEHERREEVIQYIYGKYGRHRAALAATVITYRSRSAVRDVGKALGFSLEQVDRLAKSFQWWDGGESLSQTPPLPNRHGDSHQLPLPPSGGGQGERGNYPSSPPLLPRGERGPYKTGAEMRSRARSLSPSFRSRRGAHTSAHPLDGADVHRTSATSPSRLPPGEREASRGAGLISRVSEPTLLHRDVRMSQAQDAQERPPLPFRERDGERERAHIPPSLIPSPSRGEGGEPKREKHAHLPPPSFPPPQGGREASRGALRAHSVFRERLREAGFDPENPRLIHLVELVRQLRGFPRHLSQHVGGFVIARDRLSRLVPIENAAMPERTVIQWDKDDIDALGLLKVDCLGLGMLTVLHKAFDLIARWDGRRLAPATVPPEDPKVYEMICHADTVGVFQIESRAQMSMLPRLKPRCFYDLVIEIAIVRPGPIQGNMVHPYLRRRQQCEPVSYPSEEARAVLERTLGVPIFQEQVIKLAMVAAGFSAGEADGLRRAMAAWHRRGGLEPYERRLIDGMRGRGYSETFARRIFEQIKGFGEYGFPESHSASFALIAYVSAWLKHHEPAVFLAALLNSQPMGFYQPAQLVQDARRHGVEVRPVDVCASEWDCTLEGAESAVGVAASHSRSPGGSGTGRGGDYSLRFGNPEADEVTPAMRLGLRHIKGLSRAGAERLTTARAAAPFADVADMVRRSALDRRDRAALASSGALKGLAGHRYRARWAVAGVEPERPLLARVSIPEAIPLLRAPTEAEDLVADYAHLGLTLGRHPLVLLRKRLAARGFLPAAAVRAVRSGWHTRTAGLVVCRQHPGSANGVIFLTLEDETGHTNVIVWPSLVERYRRALVQARLLLVDGEVQREGEVLHVIARRLADHSSLLGDLAVRSRDFQ